jgi:hypothetical protein
LASILLESDRPIVRSLSSVSNAEGLCLVGGEKGEGRKSLRGLTGETIPVGLSQSLKLEDVLDLSDIPSFGLGTFGFIPGEGDRRETARLDFRLRACILPDTPPSFLSPLVTGENAVEVGLELFAFEGTASSDKALDCELRLNIPASPGRAGDLGDRAEDACSPKPNLARIERS